LMSIDKASDLLHSRKTSLCLILLISVPMLSSTSLASNHSALGLTEESLPGRGRKSRDRKLPREEL
jgi:hypothetical protein